MQKQYLNLWRQQFTRVLIVYLITVGFALLPFLWAVNAVWFLKEAFVVPAYEEQQQIKKCQYRSLRNHVFYI